MFKPIGDFFGQFATPKQEDFYNKGWLTPEQFVQAGDQLTLTGWQWKKSPKGFKPTMEPPHQEKHFLEVNAVSDYRIKDFFTQNLSTQIDKDGFAIIQSDSAIDDKLQEKEKDQRNYTITITYDRKYHCPRLWLQGVSLETNDPLSKNQIFEDIMSDYQDLTVTVENHTFLGFPCLTIHPCYHSETLKSFIDKAKSNGVTLKPQQALAIFLKFMSSVMPTVISDFTFNVG